MKKYNKIKLPAPLGGEAEKGSYKLVDGNKKKVSGIDAIFPILKEIKPGEWEFIGTGFFITDNGIFVSAKHVFMDVMDKHRNQTHPIFILQRLHNNEIIQRNVRYCSTNDIADVGIGVLDQLKYDSTGEIVKNKIVTLTSIPPDIGETIVTFAYPRHIKTLENDEFSFLFLPDFYDGKLEDFYPNGRDQVTLPAPCYRTTINIHGGASGGPVFGPSGHAFGVNSTSFSSTTDISFVSRINEILSLRVKEVRLHDLEPESTTIFELAKHGFIKFKPSLHMIQSRTKNGILVYSY
ncbi:MAG: hypothetical protein GF353_20075 [Candidatus Lokiarchaeota archaeon]|nr:hypothetical protein [Candidatus Lokiarchaeota archaeon]